MPQTKVATCCYCGTRAALVLTGQGRHELSCSACGAPLHNLKMLKSNHAERSPSEHAFRGKAKKPKKPTQPNHKRSKKKKREGIGAWLAEEIWDAVEDIFD